MYALVGPAADPGKASKKRVHKTCIFFFRPQAVKYYSFTRLKTVLYDPVFDSLRGNVYGHTKAGKARVRGPDASCAKLASLARIMRGKEKLLYIRAHRYIAAHKKK